MTAEFMPDFIAAASSHPQPPTPVDTGDLNHAMTVEKPPLVLEVYLLEKSGRTDDAVFSRMKPYLNGKLWPVFFQTVGERNIPQQLNLQLSDQIWEVDLNLVDNAAIRAINHQYRGKNEATDVLSFPLYNEAAQSLWKTLPEIQLGSIFISMEWAKSHAERSDAIHTYILERFLHGLLHLMGQNHDTIEDYRTVLAIQHNVLRQLGLEI